MDQNKATITSWCDLQGNKYLKQPCVEMLTEGGLVIDKQGGNPNTKTDRPWLRVRYDRDYVIEWLDRVATSLGGVAMLKALVNDLYLQGAVVSDNNHPEIIEWIKPLAVNLGGWQEILDCVQVQFEGEQDDPAANLYALVGGINADI
jgi:hypothetical protein